MGGGVLDIAPAVVWLGVAAAALAFGMNVWGLFSGPSRANSARIDALARRHEETARETGQRLDGHDLRLGRLEQSLQAMPSKDDMHAVQLAVEGMRGELKAMRAEIGGTKDIMERLENVVTRHEDHLLEGKR